MSVMLYWADESDARAYALALPSMDDDVSYVCSRTITQRVSYVSSSMLQG